MKPAKIELSEAMTFFPTGVAVNLAESQQDRYRVLPAIRLPDGSCICRWQFTADERERIARGEDLYLRQLTFGQRFQPILPSVGVDEVAASVPTPPAAPVDDAASKATS